MSKILAGNVFITKDKKVMERLFLSDSKIPSFSERVSLLNENDNALTFIGSPLRNDGLLRFEYSFMEGKPVGARVRFIETSKLVEFLLLYNQPMAMRLAKAIDNEIKQKRAELFKHYAGMARRRESRPNYAESVMTDKEIEELVDRDMAIVYSDILANKRLDFMLRHSEEFYFAFGAGDKLEDWSGPYFLRLSGVTLINSEDGARIIEATFVPSTESLKIWNDSFQEAASLDGNATTSDGSTKRFNSYHDKTSVLTHSTVISYETEVSYGAVSYETKNNYELEKDKNELLNGIEKNLNAIIRQLCINYGKMVTSNDSPDGDVIAVFPQDFEEEYNRTKNKNLSTEENLVNFFRRHSIPVSNGTEVVEDIEASEEVPMMSSADAQQAMINGNKPSKYVFQIGIGVVNSQNTDGGSPKPILKPLYDLYASFDDKAANGPDSFEFFEENNTKLVDYWKSKGMVNPQAKSVLVMGNARDIKKVLYAEDWDPNDEKLRNQPNKVAAETTTTPRDPDDTLPGSSNPTKTRTNKRISFFNDDYVRGLSEITNRKRSSAFNDSELPPNISKNLNNPNALIFRHNISNPNVLSVDYTLKNYYHALFSFKFEPDIETVSRTSTGARKVVKDLEYGLGSTFISKINDIITKKLDEYSFNDEQQSLYRRILFLNDDEVEDIFLSEVANKVANSKELKELSLIDLGASLEFLRQSKANNYTLPTNTLESKVTITPDKYAEAHLALQNELEKLIVDVRIKTLPFFNQITYLNRDCELVGLTTQPVGSKGSVRRVAPYTGSFNVLGFAHVIDSEEMYSEFRLVRKGVTSDKVAADPTLKDYLIELIDAKIDALINDTPLLLTDSEGNVFVSDKLPSSFKEIRYSVSEAYRVSEEIERLKKLKAKLEEQ
jgi:hypothetical protein